MYKNYKKGSTLFHQMLYIWERNQHDQHAQHDPPLNQFQNIPTTPRILPLHAWTKISHIDTIWYLSDLFPERVWAKGFSNSMGLSNIFTFSHLLIFTSHLQFSHHIILTSSHLHIFSCSHLLIFTFSHLHITTLHLLIFTASHPHVFKSSHLHIFSSSHHIFTPSYLHIFSSSHLHILTCSHPHMFTSSHPHIFSSSHLRITSSHLLILTSSHLHIFTSSHLLIFTSSHPHILTSSHLHILSCPLALLPSCSFALLLSCPLLFPFSRMRSKGSRFTLGVWGLRVCSLDVVFVFATVRNCSQPSATVRVRDRMAVPMVSSAEVVIFGGFKRLVASFRVAGVALRVIQMCFVTRRNSFCVAGAILLRRFQKMCCSFRGRRNTLEVSIVILRGRRSSLDVSVLRVFCKSHGQGCVQWRQGANTVAGVAFCEMGWKLTEASNEKSILRYQNFRFMRKLVGKRRFWCYKVSKWRKSRTKCSFCCSHVSPLESLVFLWPRRVYGGSCKPSPFRMFPSRLSCRFAWQARHFVTFQSVLYRVESVKIGGSLARNARFAAPTCLVSSRWFSCGLAVSMGEAANPLLFECFQAGCHVVLSGRRGALWHSNLFFALHTPHSTLPTPHFTLHTLHFTLHTLHFILYTLHSTLYTLHFALYTPHSTLYT